MSQHRSRPVTPDEQPPESSQLANVLQDRFAEWGLTKAEADVTLFALKGCDAAEIARLRGTTAGTVRAQLSRAYGKAGVGSHAALVSLFIEDLLEVAPAKPESLNTRSTP